jgi:hypothetical protein
MKLGDKKQAIGLGVGAFIAIGMLAKTAFATFAKTGSDDRVVVRDIGGAPTPINDTEKASDRSQPITEPTKNQQSEEYSKSIRRDAFEVPFVPAKTKPFESGMRRQAAINRETTQETGSIPPASVDIGKNPDLSGTVPSGGGARLGDQGPDKTKVAPKKSADIFIRYDGFVEAGSPMAVVSINGKSLSVEVGSSLSHEIEIDTITNKKITLHKGNLKKTIYIGKETKIQ